MHLHPSAITSSSGSSTSMLPPSFSRRKFLHLSAGLSSLATVGRSRAAAADGPPVRAGRTQPKRFTIDCHLHYQQRPLFFETLLTFYRERNAMACCNGFRAQFSAIAEAAKKNPETIIPWGRIVI